MIASHGKLRLHVVSLPHTQVTKDFARCIFTEKVRRFCVMMSELGHDVVLYAGEQVDSSVTELVTCISEEQRTQALGSQLYTSMAFDSTQPFWKRFDDKVIQEMSKRIQPRDFVCLVGGSTQKRIAEAVNKAKAAGKRIVR